MDIPFNLVIKSLTGFCVCRFKNKNFASEAPSHFYVAVPVKDDLNLLFCTITSQIEKKVWYYRRTNDKAISCLVRINIDTFHFLKKNSIIECNQPLLISKNELINIIDPEQKFKIIVRDIPLELKEKIINAIKDSPIVKPFIKKMLLEIES